VSKLHLLVFTFLIFSAKVKCQKLYQASEVNVILSVADINRNGDQIKTPVRFAPFVNISQQLNFDISRNLGICSGVEIKNIGLTMQDSIISKHRAYSGGINLSVKLGNFKRNIYVFAGGSYEYLFSYKERIILDNEEIIRRNYYRNDINQFLPALMAGVNIKGLTFRVQYYLDNFFSDKYAFVDNANNIYSPLEKSELILVMIGLRKNFKDILRKKEKDYHGGSNAFYAYKNAP